MALETLTYSKSWENPEDFPAYEPDEKQVRADLQLLHNEARDAINRLVEALSGPSAASQLPVAPIGTLTAETVQQAIEQVYEAVQNAASALIIDGSVTKEKLAQQLLERIYGGKLWVSMDEPTEEENPGTDFPVGQLWLRPNVTVKNLAQEDWETVGGSALPDDDGWCFTTDGTQDYLTASQLLETVGTAGQRVVVCLSLGECSSTLEELSLYINGVEQELTEDGCCVEAALDQTGSLELLLRGQWPMELEQEEIHVQHLSVVNVQALLPADCGESKNWAAFVENLGAFEQTELPMTVYLQAQPGQWETIYTPVLPVSKGGTGLACAENGALLYGTGNDRLCTLPPSNGVLQWAEGRLRWITEAALAEQGSYARIATGQYIGNASTSAFSHTLPAEPVLLILDSQAPREDTLILVQGISKSGRYTDRVNKEFYTYDSYVTLQGGELVFSQEYENVALPCLYMNTDGVTYNWTAIY